MLPLAAPQDSWADAHRLPPCCAPARAPLPRLRRRRRPRPPRHLRLSPAPAPPLARPLLPSSPHPCLRLRHLPPSRPDQHHPSPRARPRAPPTSTPPVARAHRSTRALTIRHSPDARLMAAPRGRLPPATSGRSRPLVYGATDRDRGGDVVSRGAPARKSGRGQPSPPRSTPVQSYYSNDDPAARTVRDKLPALPVRAKLWRTPRLVHLIDSPSYVLLCFLQR